MGNGDRAGKDRKPTASSSSAGGRAARSKVELPASVKAKRAAGSGDPPDRPRGPVVKRPWWRKGQFWFGVIAVEAIVALALSLVFSTNPDDISIDGVEVGSFCTTVEQVRATALDTGALDSPAAVSQFQLEADTYRRLESSAPTDVRPDLLRLADLMQELVDTANSANQKHQADPSYLPLNDISAKQGDVTARAATPARRFELAVQKACGIDLNAPVTTTPSGTGPAGTAQVSPTTQAVGPSAPGTTVG